ncbi:MAG: PLP-dependent aspartate aminotransferase family protein [Liquorilactobacillus mali]|uniref:trans-sulfuration enzyme family protein n=1 Tax=Liquorilactobacillus mali TaxID=1618 RepID=UPI0039E9309A
MSKFNTNLVHGLPCNENKTGAVNPPIYNSTTYAYPDSESKIRWDYARSGNPTREFLEKLVAQLENGDRGFAFSSGMAAIHAVLSIFSPGDHLIIGDQIYGGTFRLFNQFFKRWNIEFTAVDTRDSAAVKAAIKPNTKAIYFEPFTNPLLHVTSVRSIAEIAQKNDLLVIVDNTFLTPYLQQPLNLGADIVIHSATKYLGGHSDVIAGIVVTKSKELSDKLYFSQNAIGGVLSPEDSNLIRRGIQTLSVRLDRQLLNTQKIVAFLQKRADIKKINYPGIEGTAEHEIAKNECKDFGAVLSFEVQNIDVVKFVNNLKLFKLAVSLGAVESLAELPSKMSHAELSDKELLACGISPNLVRLAIGIEDADDLIADLEQALAAAK